MLNNAYVGQRVSAVSGRVAKHYKCVSCTNAFPQSKIAVDHIKPVGVKDNTWKWINRLFCAESNLQVLCDECHLEKTNRER